MHEDLPGIDRRKKVLAEKWPKAEGENDTGNEADEEGFGAPECEQQQRAVAIANAGEARVKRVTTIEVGVIATAVL